jgi:hypothetical protein
MDVDFEELYTEPMKRLRLDVRSNGDMKEGICEEPNEESIKSPVDEEG